MEYDEVRSCIYISADNQVVQSPKMQLKSGQIEHETVHAKSSCKVFLVAFLHGLEITGKTLPRDG